MKKLFYISVFIITLLCIPSTIKASCSDTRLVELKKIASNINFSYTYTEKNNAVLFKINITNMNKHVYVYDYTYNKTYKYKDDIEVYGNNYEPGQTIRFDIYATECNANLHTTYLILPPYNRYYSKDSCKGYEDYYLCQKWAKVNYTEEAFDRKLEEYKESIIKPTKPQEKIEEEVEVWYQKILNFLLNYYFYILAFIIVSCSSLMLYLGNKDKFDFNVKR